MTQLQFLAALLVISVARQTQAQQLGCTNSDYIYLGSKCYKTVLEPGKTYCEAKNVCKSDGGRLAAMATPVEAIAVLSSIALASSEGTVQQQHGLWIGLNDKKEENVYEWEDGRKVSDTIDLFGEQEEPNNPTGYEDCGRIQQNMWWTMWTCRDTSAEGYVCEMVTDCPSSGNWARLRNKCFHLAKTSNEVDFFHAQGLCQQQHPQANLAKIESMSELNRIVSVMMDAGLGSNDALWFGATDFVSEGSFIYPDGSAALPLSGSHVFSAANEDKDFSLVKQNEWLTEAWDYGDASGYVCSIDLSCQLSWQAVDNSTKSCYMFNEQYMDWYEAKAKCEDIGMHLVAIETSDEHQLLAQYIKDNGIPYPWTAGNVLSGSWQWDGLDLPMNLPSVWAPNQPYPNGFKCAYLNANSGGLQTYNCNDADESICEFRLY
ncbi:hypothetical protein CAPTEDRAFT_196723 [Capitella teleta]|uniref:C-type lectin domain-containing protein n=1 Tax=Capitella teleta TaxID=283909 RepID=R7U997_CAPTE|nr:hypothetical protein CAPTEDRAFT_196723 [Capitella teleta]|eukprot:ELU02544.1 hypothetical protein CAPTEDRAFT_196723 [Capitella teleta]